MSPLKVLLSVCAFSAVMFSTTSTAEIYPPDPRFSRGTAAQVHFADQGADMDRICQDVGVYRAPNFRLRACAGREVSGNWHIWIRNPCGIDEPYAKELCHEMSHVNGFVHPEYL